MTSMTIGRTGTLILLIAAVILGGCQTSKSGMTQRTPPIKSVEVKLQVTGSPKELSVNDGPLCSGGSTMGCIEVDVNQIALVTFRLLQHEHWDLTEMWICQQASKPEPQDCTLTTGQAAEFEVLTTAGTTVPFGTDGNADLGAIDQFTLIDQNVNEQDYWWLIRACRTDDPNVCSTLDPRLRNGGRE